MSMNPHSSLSNVLMDVEFEMESRDVFSTGLSVLDGRLGGGLAAGSIVVVEYPAESSGEQLGYSLFQTDSHNTLYLSTFRSTKMVKEALQETDQTMGDMDPAGAIVSRDAMTSDSETENDLSGVQSLIPDFQSASIVVDLYSDFAKDNPAWEASLMDFAEFMKDRGGVCYLMVHPPESREEQDIVRRAKYLSDIVLQYETAESTQGNDQLVVSKARTLLAGGNELPIILDLDVQQTLGISRDRSFS
jgi:archaellum biogenesis ATPase FlaH